MVLDVQWCEVIPEQWKEPREKWLGKWSKSVRRKHEWSLIGAFCDNSIVGVCQTLLHWRKKTKRKKRRLWISYESTHTHTHKDESGSHPGAGLRTGCFDKGNRLSVSGTQRGRCSWWFSAMHDRPSAVYKHMIHGSCGLLVVPAVRIPDPQSLLGIWWVFPVQVCVPVLVTFYYPGSDGNMWPTWKLKADWH